MQMPNNSAHGAANNAPNVKLPPISNGATEGTNSNAVNGQTAHGQTNGHGQTDGHGQTQSTNKGVHVSAKSQQLIYRSIPPKVQNFTLSDMLDSSVSATMKSKKPKGSSLTSSSEFAKRFMARPVTQPKVIDFSVGKVKMEKRRRGINGFFPPVKLRVSAKKEYQKSLSSPEPTQISTRLQLVPTSFSEVRPRSSKSRSISRASRTSRTSVLSRKTPDSIRTAPPTSEGLAIYPETFDCDDLSYLPPPKRILPKRDVPWVFRYKVKRNMNELSKILASKPSQLVDA